MMCYKYRGLGHIASECPSKKLMGIFDYDPYRERLEDIMEVEEKEEEGSKTNEIIIPGLGDCLVIRRVLSGRPQVGESNQREEIFHSRCTILGKVCSLIVDGGSCTNEASQLLIQKLKLPTLYPNLGPM